MNSSLLKNMQIERALTLAKDSYRGKRVVFVSGNFNIVHPGHLRLLNFAHACGDVLLVGLFSDDAPGVVVGFEDRKATLLGLESVTSVVEIRPNGVADALRILEPQTVVKGKEHEESPNIEQEVVAGYGGHLIFSGGDQRFSSRDLIRREMVSAPSISLKEDYDFLREHGLSYKDMSSRVDQFSNARVLVVGDLIIDEYIYCDPLGMSQEDPTIVVSPIESKKFVGAAGIVAAHLAGLGASSTYFSIVGNDNTSHLAESLLGGYGVDTCFIRDESRPTILKQRFRARGKTLLRVSHLRSHDAGAEYWQPLLESLKKKIISSDLVIFSDFNYGCLPQKFVVEISRLCCENKVPFVADSQSSSQTGNIGRFGGADFLAATEREVRLAVNDFTSGLQSVTNTLFKQSQSQGLFVKLGEEGLILVTDEGGFRTSSLAALNSNPVDVAGAGDAFLAAASLCRVAGSGFPEAAYLGSLAAAIQVARVGNLPLGVAELKNQLRFGV